LRDSLSLTEMGRNSFPEFQDELHTEKIVRNVTQLMNSGEISKNHELRSILMNVIFKEVPHSKISELIPTCSLRTVQRNMAKPDQIPELAKINLRHRKSQYSEEEEDFFKLFFNLYCPPQSGKKRLIQRCSNKELYELYKMNVSSHNTTNPQKELKARSANVFFSFRKKFHVKLSTKHDQFACPKCEAYQRNIARRLTLYQEFMFGQWSLELQLELDRIELEIAVCEAHKWINPHQRQEFNFQRQHLGNDSAIVVMDFTGIGEFGAPHTFQILVLSQISICPNSRTETIKYFDVFMDAANDFFFFRAAIRLFFQQHLENRLKKVFLWSDGCAKHFKQRKSQYLMSLLAQEFNLQIHWNFFCSNHAHNICDGHAAVLKRILNNWIKHTGRKMPDVEEYKEMIENAKRQEGFTSKIEAIALPDIDSTDVVCSAMNGLRCIHHFEYPNPGTVKGAKVCEYSQPFQGNQYQTWNIPSF